MSQSANAGLAGSHSGNNATVHRMEHADQAADHATAPDAKVAERARRAASFGAAATAYARHRPDYPIAAIRWALEPVGGTGRPIRALDLGAGTGKLTAQLANLSVDTEPVGVAAEIVAVEAVEAEAVEAEAVEVVAVEPDPAMLAELRRQLPGVNAMAGRAEAIPLPEASVDAVLAGQAAPGPMVRPHRGPLAVARTTARGPSCCWYEASRAIVGALL
jgi:SAM-dependent methyltransferase